MSPTATIVTVVVALIFVAWIFQSDTRDPALDAALRRQQEKQAENAQRASLGITVTDAGITKDNTSVTDRTRRPDGGNTDTTSPGTSDNTGAVPGIGATGVQDDPTQPGNQREPFRKNTWLEGTFVGMAYVDHMPQVSLPADEPSITFHSNGSFTTQNMARADVDMEAPSNPNVLDHGSGNYKLSGDTLTLIYTDGLTRAKKNNRSFTVLCIAGNPDNPGAITIQGKPFRKAMR